MSKYSESQLQIPPITESRFSGGGDSALQTTTIVQWIQEIQNPETRERALSGLSKNRAVRGDLAPLLWHSFGTVSILLQEITSVYASLSSPYLTDRETNRVCNALLLLQEIATHPETKLLFIKAKIPLYLFPFLDNTNNDRGHEYVRLSSLGVIGALVKVDDPEVIHFLLKSEIFPCVLRCMEVGMELSKTVATFIVYRILLNDEGLKYCCVLGDRLLAVARVLAKMIEKLAADGRIAEDHSKRLLKHIIWCFHRLSENTRACLGLRICLPLELTDSSFINVIRDDYKAMLCLEKLFQNVEAAPQSTAQKVTPPTRPLLRHRYNAQNAVPPLSPFLGYLSTGQEVVQPASPSLRYKSTAQELVQPASPLRGYHPTAQEVVQPATPILGYQSAAREAVQQASPLLEYQSVAQNAVQQASPLLGQWSTAQNIVQSATPSIGQWSNAQNVVQTASRCSAAQNIAQTATPLLGYQSIADNVQSVTSRLPVLDIGLQHRRLFNE